MRNKLNLVDSACVSLKSLFIKRALLQTQIFGIVLLAACSGKTSVSSNRIAPERKISSANEVADPTAILSQVTRQTTVQADVSTGSADLIHKGPNIILLNSKTLKSVLTPLFGNTPRSGRSESLAGNFFNTAPEEYFTADEKEMLGDYEILTVGTKIKKRMSSRLELNQDYIFALRTFAANACHKLVEAEFSAPQKAENKLVKSAEAEIGASPETISSFMSAAFTYSPTEGLHTGAGKFSEIMKANVSAASAADKANALKNNYKLICAYVVTDPRTFTR
jgi:hypothetical protein